MTDPIADMLTRIRNAQMASKRSVSIPFSKIKLALAEILVKEGFVNKAVKEKNIFDEIKIDLKYVGKNSVIQHIKRISKPSCRVYATYADIPYVLNGHGMVILSTSKGILVDRDARSQKIGGELICEIY